MSSHAAQQTRGARRAAPFGALARAFQRQRRTSSGVRLPGYRDQHGGGMFHGAAQAKPRGERNAVRGGERGVAQVQHDHAETAALDQQVGGFEGSLGAAGTNPNQPLQLHASRGGRRRVKGVLGIHQRANFFARGGLGQNRKQQAGAARRSRPDDLGEAPARQPAGGAIDLPNSRGEHLRRRPRLPFQRATQQGFELFFERRRHHNFRFLFACTIFLQELGYGCQEPG